MKNYRSGWPFHFPCKAILLFLFCSLIYRCGSALYVPTIADQERTGIMLDSLSEGRKLYVEHCGSCHNLHLPEQFNSTEWEKNVAEMQEKGKITRQPKSEGIVLFEKCMQKIKASHAPYKCNTGLPGKKEIVVYFFALFLIFLRLYFSNKAPISS